MRNIIIFSESSELQNQLTIMLHINGFAHIYSSHGNCVEALSLTYRLNPKLIIIDMELPSNTFSELLKLFPEPMKKIILFIAPHSNTDSQILKLIKMRYVHFIVHPISEQLFVNQVLSIVNQGHP